MNTYMETPRLILRDWKEEDIPVFAGLNNNDQVLSQKAILSGNTRLL